MTNSTFHKLLKEFEVNMEDNTPFKDWVKQNFIPKYLDGSFSTEQMKEARSVWKKNHPVWYADGYEVWLSLDAMPFGGWASEKKEGEFLKAYRKALKEGHSQGLGENTITRIFMQKYVPDWK